MRIERNETVTNAAAVFSFFYAGTLLATPLYRSGHTLARYMAMSLLIAVFLPLCVKYFENREPCGRKGVRMVTAVMYVLAVSQPAACFVSAWTADLPRYADEYGSLAVRLFSGLGCAACAVWAASEGKNAVAGIMTLTCLLYPLWTGVGSFACLETGSLCRLSPPFDGMDVNEWKEIGKELIPTAADCAVLAAFVTDGAKGGRAVRHGAGYGAAAFVILAGINVMKNLLLFGEKLTRVTALPNLAAVRLVPMLELPEMSVIVGAVSLTVRLGVYAAVGRRMIVGICKKNALALSAVLPFLAGALRLLVQSNGRMPYDLPEGLLLVAAALACVMAVIGGKRQNNCGNDGVQ